MSGKESVLALGMELEPVSGKGSAQVLDTVSAPALSEESVSGVVLGKELDTA